MRTLRNFISASGVINLFNSKSSFYFLLAAFIILLIAAENLIKYTFVAL